MATRHTSRCPHTLKVKWFNWWSLHWSLQSKRCSAKFVLNLQLLLVSSVNSLFHEDCSRRLFRAMNTLERTNWKEINQLEALHKFRGGNSIASRREGFQGIQQISSRRHQAESLEQMAVNFCRKTSQKVSRLEVLVEALRQVAYFEGWSVFSGDLKIL